jgi:hypothetical protein
MKINIFKTNYNFTCKTNRIHFNYYLGDPLIVRTDCVNDPAVTIDNQLHFHRCVDYLHTRALKLLGLIRFVAYHFSSLDSQSYVTTDGQSGRLSWCQAPIWDPRPDFYCCQTVSGLLSRGTFSDVRTELSFTIAPGPR